MVHRKGRASAAAQPLSLKARAVALLAQREHSPVELRRKLMRIARDRDEPRALPPRRSRRRPTEDDDSGGVLTSGHDEWAGAVGLDSLDEALSLPEAEDTDAADSQGSNAEARAEEVEAVLTWLTASGYLDPQRFVESRIHLRSQRFGQRRIEQELAQHGLSMDAEQRAHLSAGELDKACELLRRKFGDTLDLDQAAEARQMRFLLGRGFGGDVVRRAIRQAREQDRERADNEDAG